MSALFPDIDDVYLLSHSVGLAPRGLRKHVDENFFDPWQRTPDDVWTHWLSTVDRYREALAALFTDTAANFCPQTNLSSAATKVLYSLPELRERPVVLLSEEAFPSLGYVFHKAEEHGFRVKFLSKSLNAADPNVWREHLTPDVGLVLVTHVHSNTGQQLPIEDIAQVARECGALSLVDTAQSNGILPIDLSTNRFDFVIGSCVKWLCGGPGAGFLWVNPRMIDRTNPVDVGWFSHESPFEFDIRNFRFADDALRFWGGTPSVLPLVAATHSMNVINSIGVGQIRAHNIELTERLVASIDEGMLAGPSDANQRGGTVVVNLGGRREKLLSRLKASRVRFDERAEGIRLSPHIYNDRQDMETVIQCLA
ncbi:MAG: aminotransferase class V-fold PLP-dependent enzyme [Pseudomonadota bacterium]